MTSGFSANINTIIGKTAVDVSNTVECGVYKYRQKKRKKEKKG